MRNAPADLQVAQLQEAQTEAGDGVRGLLDGRLVAVGRQEWVQRIFQPHDPLPAGRASFNTA
jgi:cation transport ATPase